MKIIGLRIEKYIGETVSGHNCNFTYEKEELEKHILCAILENGTKVEIDLSQSDGECGSGWCTATYGEMIINEVYKFNSFTHIPNKELVIDDLLNNQEHEINNEVFSFSVYGGDVYYPGGYYNVNMELFKETARGKKLRPVWIFKGKSDSGKSYLSSRLIDMTVYETDSRPELPINITESVIVLGNKYNFSIEDIKKNIFGEAEIQIVTFE